jgi:hypothetical protein
MDEILSMRIDEALERGAKPFLEGVCASLERRFLSIQCCRQQENVGYACGDS